MVVPLIAAGISGLMGLAGGMMQNSAASAAADKQMAFQQASNERQMAFQENSAKSQYQWAMGDMKAAGLNPILAYKQGGAGTLSGSSSSGSSYTPQNVGSAAVSAASTGATTALQTQRNAAELDNIAADTLLKGSQDKTQGALAAQAVAQAGQANANTAVALQEAQNKVMEYDLLRESLIQQMPKSTIAKFDQEFWSSPAAGPLLATRRFMESVNPTAIANSASNFIGR